MIEISSKLSPDEVYELMLEVMREWAEEEIEKWNSRV